jgi:hypothetical protein
MSTCERYVPKLWGREVIFYEGEYCAKLLVYDGLRISSRHYHETKHETFFIVRGTFEVQWHMLDHPEHKGTHKLVPGAVLVLAPRTVHRVECLSPDGGIIAEASSGENAADCTRLEDSVNPFGAP